MRLLIACIGRLKDGGERALVERYRTRFDPLAKKLGFHPVNWLELPESRAASAEKRCADEAEALARTCRDVPFRIVLDVKGKGLSSEEFARLLAKTRDDGQKAAALLVGGPDGHGPDMLTTAQVRLSLGPMTLPHGLARVVLAEQLYRAATILSGHPYHRA